MSCVGHMFHVVPCPQEEDEEVDGSHGDGGGCHGDGGVSPVEEENVFVSPAPKTHTFGRDGTKAA